MDARADRRAPRDHVRVWNRARERQPAGWQPAVLSPAHRASRVRESDAQGRTVYQDRQDAEDLRARGDSRGTKRRTASARNGIERIREGDSVGTPRGASYAESPVLRKGADDGLSAAADDSRAPPSRAVGGVGARQSLTARRVLQGLQGL